MSDYIDNLVKHVQSKQPVASSYCRFCGEPLNTGNKYHVKCAAIIDKQMTENRLTEERLEEIALQRQAEHVQAQNEPKP